MDLNHLRMSPKQEYKFQKILLASAIWRSKVFVSVLAALISGIFRRWALLAVFENFLENTESCEPKKYTTFIDSPLGTSGRNIRIGIFSIMCHFSRGREKNALLTSKAQDS